MIHESVYRILRGHGETDSRRARHFTAYLFSGGKVESVYPGNNYLTFCESVYPSGPATFFYIVQPPPAKDSEQHTEIAFGMINGRFLLSRTYFEITDNTKDSQNFLNNLKNPNPNSQYIYQAMGTKSQFEGEDMFYFYVGGQQSTELFVRGTSGVDGSSFSTPMKCHF